MRYASLTSILLLLCALQAGAQATNPPAASPAADISIYAVRDPFWPIGYRPPAAQTNAVVVQTAVTPSNPLRWEDATKLLQVTALSTLPDGRQVAHIKNIGLVEAGDSIALRYDGLTYRWEITAVTSDGIVTKRVGVSAQREQ